MPLKSGSAADFTAAIRKSVSQFSVPLPKTASYAAELAAELARGRASEGYRKRSHPPASFVRYLQTCGSSASCSTGREASASAARSAHLPTQPTCRTAGCDGHFRSAVEHEARRRLDLHTTCASASFCCVNWPRSQPALQLAGMTGFAPPSWLASSRLSLSSTATNFIGIPGCTLCVGLLSIVEWVSSL